MKATVITGVVLSEEVSLSLGEVCRCCGVSAETIIELVDEGVVTPQGRAPESWRFPGPALRRAQMALRLGDELRVNLAGAALALDLMEELEVLRRQLQRLSRREQSEDGL
jgi:chaperone modulatory protein CbpM